MLKKKEQLVKKKEKRTKMAGNGLYAKYLDAAVEKIKETFSPDLTGNVQKEQQILNS